MIPRRHERQAASSFLTDPTQTFLRVERAALGGDDPALWRHLGAEPQRVLDVAGEYMRIGAFAQALDVLDREYPAVPDLEREPGAVAPQDHVLVAYYRGYGRERLGRSGAADYLRASASLHRLRLPEPSAHGHGTAGGAHLERQ